MDECTEATRDALQDVSRTLEQLATQAGVVTGLLETINRAMTRLTDVRSSQSYIVTDSMHETVSFVDYQTRMVAVSKEIARLAQEMVLY